MNNEPKSLVTMEKNIQELFKEKTPKSAIKLRKGSGGMMFPYVPIDYVVTKLDEKFGIYWEFIVDDVRKTEYQIIVRGRLLIKDPQTNFSISRPGIGRANIKFYRDQSNKPVDEGNDEKAATSDAIKKAASLFGIAADVYYKEIEKYTDVPDEVDEEKERQGKAMSTFFAVASERGFDADEAKKRVKLMYKVEHMNDLTSKQIEIATIKVIQQYEVVMPGEAPRRIGEAPKIKIDDPEISGSSKDDEFYGKSEIEVALEKEKESTYTCKGEKHKDTSEEEKPVVPVGEFCSKECQDSYWNNGTTKNEKKRKMSEFIKTGKIQAE